MKPRDEKCIFVADDQKSANTVKNILGDQIKIISSNSLLKAVELLGQNVTMILCGVHFDECRMFDFLRIVKANPATRNIPFLCYRGLHSPLELTVYESLHISCKALGASGFVDLYELKTQLGIAQADAKFKNIIYDTIDLSPKH